MFEAHERNNRLGGEFMEKIITKYGILMMLLLLSIIPLGNQKRIRWKNTVN